MEQYEYLFLKVLILINKLFPFIIFISAILWILRLKKLRTWSIFQCAGGSVIQILKGPTFAVIFISLFELLYWGPWCHNMMEKAWNIQKKENYWVQPQSRWKFIHLPNNVSCILHIPDAHMELFFFNKDFTLQKYLYAKKFFVHPGKLRLQQVWSMPIGKHPKLLPSLILDFPFLSYQSQGKHPFLMSFLELNTLSHNVFLSQTILLRRHYFLSNTVWFCLLLPFASAVLGGYQRSIYKYISRIFFGTVMCFLLFLFKEWSCMISYAMTGHILSYCITWFVPLVTALLTLSLWISKAEL